MDNSETQSTLGKRHRTKTTTTTTTTNIMLNTKKMSNMNPTKFRCLNPGAAMKRSGIRNTDKTKS
jgi:hypothetical protein